MTKPSAPNDRSPSTTTQWEWRKIRSTAGGHKPRPPKAARFFHLPSRNPREPLTIKVSYRGGAECWYEVHARGSVARYPGHVALHDVMREINRTT